MARVESVSFVVIGVVFPSAEPAELMSAFDAAHVVTASRFLDGGSAFGAELNYKLFECISVGFIECILYRLIQ